MYPKLYLFICALGFALFFADSGLWKAN